jgi:hypothetical protein
LTLVLSARELGKLGLLSPTTGDPLLKLSDKLLGTYASLSHARRHLVQYQNVLDPPGLVCTEVRPAGEGLGGGRNLVLMVFEDREHGLVKS